MNGSLYIIGMGKKATRKNQLISAGCNRKNQEILSAQSTEKKGNPAE